MFFITGNYVFHYEFPIVSLRVSFWSAVEKKLECAPKVFECTPEILSWGTRTLYIKLKIYQITHKYFETPLKTDVLNYAIMYINASQIKDNLIITPKTRQKYLVIWSKILTFAPI